MSIRGRHGERFEEVCASQGVLMPVRRAKDPGPQLDVAAQSIRSVRGRSILEAGDAVTPVVPPVASTVGSSN